MEGFVIRALKKIKEEGKRSKELKAFCEKTLEEIRLNQEGRPETAPPDTDASKYFEALRLACQSHIPKAVETALDCLQKLIAYSYLRGGQNLPSGTPDSVAKRNLSPERDREKDGENFGPDRQRTLMDVVVETICQCGDPATSEEPVQLQTIKALLTAIISNTSEVHEATLLTAVRACYHIHLVSKNQVNKVTAKAGLQQMLAVVFQRMEAEDKRIKDEEEARNKLKDEEVRSSKAELQEGILQEETENDDNDALSPHKPHKMVGTEDFGGCMYPSVAATLGFKLEAEVGNDLPIFFSGTKKPDTAPEGDVEEGNMYQSAAEKLGFTPIAEAEEPNKPGLLLPNTEDGKAAIMFPTVHHKDAFLLFRALCKLSMRALPDDPSIPLDGSALQSKLLSLELLLAIMEGSGPCFRTNSKFVYAVRHYLCHSLIKNCTMHFKQVVGLSLRLFSTLLTHFKEQLKSEIEVFISNIFLKILDSQNSTYDLKMLVLDVFCGMCDDPTALVEMFLNYDCDFNATDLFQRIVNALAKVAKGAAVETKVLPHSVAAQKKSEEEQLSLKKRGLVGLLSVLTSLVKMAGVNQQAPASPQVAGFAEAKEANPEEIDSTSETEPPESERPAGGAAPAVVTAYKNKQTLKEEFETGILKFNLHAFQGIDYLSSKGHFEMTPKAVAAFLHEHKDALDKTQIGDLLGKEKEYKKGFCVAVLHAYVDMMDFENIVIDEAIRRFLSGFRLPGEAQKIDRMMEKFAERYCTQNPDAFVSADTAFILAFAIIMLSTDLHNPNIPVGKKMTKEGFLNQTRGISNGGNLPTEFLHGIFDRIAAEPFRLKEDEEARGKKGRRPSQENVNPFFLFGAEKSNHRKRQAFNKERISMLRASEDLFKQRRKTRAQLTNNSALFDAKDPSKEIQPSQSPFIFLDLLDESSDLASTVVNPMFEVAWCPIIGAFTQALATETNTEAIQLCLQGLRLGIQVSSYCCLPTARETFLNGLTKYTMLDTLKEMMPKNIESIKMLLTIALTDGDHLNENWYQVLKCISQLGRLHLYASGLMTDDEFLPEEEDSASTPKTLAKSPSIRKGTTSMQNFTKIFTGPTPQETAQLVDSGNARRVMGEIDPELIDKVFTGTIAYSSESINHFVTQLCHVSHEELLNTEQHAGLFRSRQHLSDLSKPRMFSLQKLIEVADFNMDKRSRIVWNGIWKVLSPHFAKIGLHPNTSVAKFAVDSLRQLSSKFLEKTELKSFNFQRLFLQPFEEIMSGSESPEIREFIIQCIAYLISTRAEQMRSAWQPVFKVLVTAAHDQKEEITMSAFSVADNLLMERFQLLVLDFVDFVNCLMAFGSSKILDVSLKAMHHAEQLAEMLGAGEVDVSRTPAAMVVDPATGAEDPGRLTLWWPLLLGLSTLVADKRAQVRGVALKTLCRVLRKAGSGFLPQTWEMLFRGVLIPIMENAWTDFTPQVSSPVPTHNTVFAEDERSWILTTAPEALSSLIQLFVDCFDVVRPMLSEVLQMLQSCICQEVEYLAVCALNSLETLLEKLPTDKMEPEHWDELVARVANLLYVCIPEELGRYTPNKGELNFPPPSPAVAKTAAEFHPVPPLPKPPALAGPNAARVKTPYGPGQLLESREEGTLVVRLAWGILYTTQGSRVLTSDYKLPKEATPSQGPNAAEQPHKKGVPDITVILASRQGIMTKAVAVLRTQKVVTLLLLQHGKMLNGTQISWLVDAVSASCESAVDFNSNMPLRAQLATSGFLVERNIPRSNFPHLLDQERQAMGLLLEVFSDVEISLSSQLDGSNKAALTQERKFNFPPELDIKQVIAGRVTRQWVEEEKYADKDDTLEIIHEILGSLWKRLFDKFVANERLLHQPAGDGPSKDKELKAPDRQARLAAQLEVGLMGPLVMETLHRIEKLRESQLSLQMKWLYPSLLNLVRCQSYEVREIAVSILQFLSSRVEMLCAQPRESSRDGSLSKSS